MTVHTSIAVPARQRRTRFAVVAAALVAAALVAVAAVALVTGGHKSAASTRPSSALAPRGALRLCSDGRGPGADTRPLRGGSSRTSATHFPAERRGPDAGIDPCLDEPADAALHRSGHGADVHAAEGRSGGLAVGAARGEGGVNRSPFSSCASAPERLSSPQPVPIPCRSPSIDQCATPSCPVGGVVRERHA